MLHCTSTRRPYMYVVNIHFRKYMYLRELQVGVCLKCMYMYHCMRVLWEGHISDIVCLAEGSWLGVINLTR